MKLYNELTEQQKDLLNRIDGYFVADKRATLKDLKVVLELLTYKYNKVKKRSK